MRIPPTPLRIAAVSFLVLGLTACGDDDSSESATTPVADTATAGTQTEDTESAETEDTVATEDDETTDEQAESDEETEAEETTDDAVDAGGSAGTREDPYAVGDSIELGDWTIVINSVTLDATDEVMAENQFNDPPAEGRQFVMVNMDATYDGEETGTAWLDLSQRVLGSGGNTFGSGGAMEDYCGSIPNDLNDGGEQFPGATVTGNVCISVPADQLDDALMILEESLSFSNDRVFVALD